MTLPKISKSTQFYIAAFLLATLGVILVIHEVLYFPGLSIGLGLMLARHSGRISQ